LKLIPKVKPDTYQATTQTIAELIANNNELVKRRRTKNDEVVEADVI
jgi:hypothetical protein